MFGLCMPTGETYLLLNDGTERSIALNDTTKPREFIMTNKYVLDAIKSVGYKNVQAIIYQPNFKVRKNLTKVSMADYYYEHAKELEQD